MDQKTYDDLKLKAEQEYRNNLEAIERVWRMSQPFAIESYNRGVATDTVKAISPTYIPQKPVTTFKDFAEKQKGWLVGSIRDFVASQSGDFTMFEVIDALTGSNPDREIKKTSVKSTLIHLERMGVIETVKRGQGHTPSTYRRI